MFIEQSKPYYPTNNCEVVYRGFDVIVYWHRPNGLLSFVDAEEGLIIYQRQHRIKSRSEAVARAEAQMNPNQGAIFV